MESFLENLKKDVQCPLCNDTLIEPKILSCFHTFCDPCIKRHAELIEEVNVFKCPKCKSEILLPQEKLCYTCELLTLPSKLRSQKDLKSSVLHSRILNVVTLTEGKKVCSVSESHSPASWYCFDCSRSMCDECLKNHKNFIDSHMVINLDELKLEDLEFILKREDDCSSCHIGQRVEVFCRTCNVLVCVFCMKQEHREHDLTSLNTFASLKREILSKHSEALDKLMLNEQEVQEQKNIALFITQNGEKAIQEVKDKTKEVINNLIRNEQELLKQIYSKMDRASRNLNIIHHIPVVKEYINNIMERGLASEMVNIQETECSEDYIFIPIQKNNISEVVFVPNEDFLKRGQMVSSIGEIQTKLKTDTTSTVEVASEPEALRKEKLTLITKTSAGEPSHDPGDIIDLTFLQQVNTELEEIQSYSKTDLTMSTVEVASEPEALRKEKLTLITKTSAGEPSHDPGDVIDVKISPEVNVEIKENNVRTDGKLEVEFIPKVAGQLTAEVRVNGNHVSNSPLVMNVKPQKMGITREFKMKGVSVESHTITGVAVNKKNSKVAVAYESHSSVHVFNTDGDLLLRYGRKGSRERQLLKPEGLAFLNETDLVIADNRNYRLCIVDTTTGKLVNTFGKLGKGEGEFNDSYGVHVDDDDNIIVACDFHNERVQVFTKDGEYQYQFGLTKEDNFHPVSAVTYFGRFYVSDYTNNIIHVFEKKDGVLTKTSTIGGKGSADGQLCEPWGLAIDNDHHLLVCDRGNNRIQKFTLDGRFVGITRDKLKDPRFVTVLNDGSLLVTTFRSGLYVVNRILNTENETVLGTPTRRSARTRRK